jgi:FkbM family methyltransferase
MPKVVLDIGSYDASDAIRIKKRYKTANVFSFEASKRNCEKVKINADKYSIKHYNFALSDKVGETTFYDSEGYSDSSGSILEPISNNIQDLTFKKPVIVPTKTIDSFCKKNQ